MVLITFSMIHRTSLFSSSEREKNPFLIRAFAKANPYYPRNYAKNKKTLQNLSAAA